MSAPARAGLFAAPIAGVLAAVAARARELGVPVYLVGGAVRDLLLGRALVDVDVAVVAGPHETLALAEALARDLQGSVKARHERFGTATVTTAGGLRLDLATTRREEYPEPGQLPVITGGATIAEDLARRDFTVHAMAAPMLERGELGELLDPYGGRGDLDARVLRLLHPRSLADDPTRALRAARYGARLGFRWDDGFAPALAESRRAGSWNRISGDRLRRSLEEVLGDERGDDALARLRAEGVLDDIVRGWSAAPPPRLEGAGPIEDRWAALLAPLDANLRRAIAERLNFSRALRRAGGVA